LDGGGRQQFAGQRDFGQGFRGQETGQEFVGVIKIDLSFIRMDKLPALPRESFGATPNEMDKNWTMPQARSLKAYYSQVFPQTIKFFLPRRCFD